MEEVSMGDTVNLPIALDSDLGRKLVSDLARYSEGQCTEQEVRKRHHFDESTWESLGENEALIEAVEAEKLRRIRNGAAKREKAQQLVVKAPDILSGIMTDPTQSARHRVDAIKTLDQFAANGPGDTPAAAEMFLIRIDLSAGGGPVETYAKQLAPTKPLSSGEPWPDIDTAPKELLPAIAANKHKDGGNGEPI
jgi:hypothetical protein